MDKVGRRLTDAKKKVWSSTGEHATTISVTPTVPGACTPPKSLALTIYSLWYVSSLQRSYLSLTSEAAIDADLKEALVESLVRLRSDERYRNDDRYVKLWMRYVSNPCHNKQYLYSTLYECT